MSAIATPTLPARAAYPTDPVYRLTVEQYHEMIDGGILGEDDPVELLEGVLFYTMPRISQHSPATRKCRKNVEPLLGEGWFYDSQEPIALSDGETEPDGFVVRGSVEDYEDHHPGPLDLALVIEVADSSLVGDRGVKVRSYARAGIGTYWILNLVDRVLEVYTDPQPAEAVPTYAGRQVLGPADTVAVTLDGREVGRIAVAALLP